MTLDRIGRGFDRAIAATLWCPPVAILLAIAATTVQGVAAIFDGGEA